MKNIILLTLALLFFNAAYSQYLKRLKFPKKGKSEYLITKDSTEIKFFIVDSVAANMKARLLGKNNFFKAYRSPGGSGNFFSFSEYKYVADQKIDFSYRDTIFKIEKQDTVYLYGFTSKLNEGNKVNRNFSKFLMSAYMQETDLVYAGKPGNFKAIPLKNKKEFWKRNWINMGYGVSYLAKDNPFMGGKRLAIGFAYTWETLHYIPIFAGPFIGRTTEDKILIPVVGLTSLLIWKGIVYGLMTGNGYLKTNKTIIESNYQIPNNLEF